MGEGRGKRGEVNSEEKKRHMNMVQTREKSLRGKTGRAHHGGHVACGVRMALHPAVEGARAVLAEQAGDDGGAPWMLGQESTHVQHKVVQQNQALGMCANPVRQSFDVRLKKYMICNIPFLRRRSAVASPIGS